LRARSRCSTSRNKQARSRSVFDVRTAPAPRWKQSQQFVDEGEADVTSLLNDQPDDFLRWWANPEKVLLNNLLGEKIMAAIDDLPKAFRIAILLVSVEGLTYDEAAEALGVPTGTVRSRMKRGRTLLQKALWEQAIEAGLTVGDNTNGCRL
jgi:RNA polymerase sigma-70 factor (ECF subfamily)